LNPESYQIGPVHALLKQAAYLTIFTVPDASRPNTPIFSDRGEMVGVRVNEELHRLEIEPEDPGIGRVRSFSRVGEPIAHVHIRWLPCPDDFEAAPGKEPPPTPVDPTRSQRFVMLDGIMVYRDKDKSGFHAFGAGRTFPIMTPLGAQLGLGSVIDVLEGFGKLRGLHGTNVVNGFIVPPSELTLSFMLRIADPWNRLLASDDVSAIRQIAHPSPTTVVMLFLGEPDPNETVRLRYSPDGTILGSEVVERLRLVRVEYDTNTRRGIRSITREGPVVGRLRGTLLFNPLDPHPVSPIYTTEGVLEFHDSCGRTVGMIQANIDEGRAFRTELPGAPGPVFRFGGFGVLGQGSGALAGATGMMSLNAAISVFPRTLSNMYALRVNDPDGRFGAALAEVCR
jgi:hypothetical protein